VLHLDDVPRPEPGRGEVLVRVVAASVNPIDWKLREGLLRELALPFIPGGDFSGRVAALGAGVGDLPKGTEVYGCIPGSMGADAEYVVCPRSALARKPRSLDHVQAASVPIAAMTAWQALFDHGKLAANELLEETPTVLILGASGGVGWFAVQLAKQAFAYVYGTASPSNVDRVLQLGADAAIDHHKYRFEDVATDVNLCIDLVGGELQRRAFQVVRRGGALVSTVQPPSEELARRNGVHATMFRMNPSAEQLREIAKRIDAGQLVVDVAKVLPLDRASEAEELNRRHEVTGKIVLRVS
jgi:NADPH:quinone reductase-like Zn-dependent oxidoreductase